MVEDANTHRVEVQLLARHVACLERFAREIHQSSGVRLTPSAIIRGFVEALDEAGGVNPDYIGSEDDLVQVFVRKLTGQKDQSHDRERMRPG